MAQFLRGARFPFFLFDNARAGLMEGCTIAGTSFAT
jgi:hypothetical protein